MKANTTTCLVMILSVLCIVFSSCARRPKGVLSPKQMENLLVDMHTLEGALQASGLAYGTDEAKTNDYYQALFAKYRMDKAQFDSCLAWYTRKPKQFERIYINVLARIETLRKEVESGKFHPVDSTALSGQDTLWPLLMTYRFTKDSTRNKLYFEIKNDHLLPRDVYELSFLHRIAPSDSSQNPHAVMYVNYWNGTVDSIYTKTRNDSILRRYTLRFGARKDFKVKSISGYLLGVDSVKGTMSAYLDSITLIRRFNPFKQDSIRAAVLKFDSTAVDKDTLPAIVPEVHLEKKMKDGHP